MSTPVFVPAPPVGYQPPWEVSKPADTRSSETTPTNTGLAKKTLANAGPAQNGPAQRRPEDMRERPRRKRLSAEERARRSRVGKAAPLCPLRPGEPCTLCQAFVTGPQDCQTVRMVMEDPDLREILAEKRSAYNQARRAKRAQVAD